MDFGNSSLKVECALLDEALSKGIKKNEKQCTIWRAYKRDHEEVAQALQTFQKDLYVNCMVPIGRRALIKGKLIHTNEVLACLGDGYFAKYSTAGAIALCERRIRRAEEVLKDLSAERDLYEKKVMVIQNDIFEDCAGREIVEYCNEDQIAEWKKMHRQREREYYQKLAKLRQAEEKRIETEDDLFNRLDYLEIEEELADEHNRLKDEKYKLFGEGLETEECYYELESDSESEEEEKEEETKEKEKETVEESGNETNELTSDYNKEVLEKTIESVQIKKSVSFAESECILNKFENDLIKKQNECISDKNDDEGDILRLEFAHSKNNPTIKSDGCMVETPADIYRIFSKPKSILKRLPNDNPSQAASPEFNIEEEQEEEEEEEEEEEKEESFKPSAYDIVVKDIKERNIGEVANENSMYKESKDTRPVSKFKRDRQQRG